MATFTKEHSIILAGDCKYTYNVDGHWHTRNGRLRLFIGDKYVTLEELIDRRWKLTGSITHNDFHNALTALASS